MEMDRTAGELCPQHKAAEEVIAGLGDLSHDARFGLAVLLAGAHLALDEDASGDDRVDLIKKRSFAALDQVVGALLAYPDVAGRFERENHECAARRSPHDD